MSMGPLESQAVPAVPAVSYLLRVITLSRFLKLDQKGGVLMSVQCGNSGANYARIRPQSELVRNELTISAASPAVKQFGFSAVEHRTSMNSAPTP